MERFFKYTLTALISIVALMEFYQVLMRYVFEIPVMGLEEVLVYPTLWLYFLGSVNASREDTQIKANVLDVFLKTERAKMVVRVIADVMALTVVPTEYSSLCAGTSTAAAFRLSISRSCSIGLAR